MFTLDRPNPPCSDFDVESLRLCVAPATWPGDHIAFLQASDGGHVAVNTFPVRPGLSDTITKMYGVSDIIRQKTALSDRMPPTVWPIADTANGNFVVLVVSENWIVGFWDHESESVDELAPDFTQFAMIVRPMTYPQLHPNQVSSIALSPGFAEKFAKFKKKG
jgi:hypothetical protein